MNLSELAKEISRLEGGKKEMSIAQIKEVVKSLSVIFYRLNGDSRNPPSLDPLITKLLRNGEKWDGKK